MKRNSLFAIVFLCDKRESQTIYKIQTSQEVCWEKWTCITTSDVDYWCCSWFFSDLLCKKSTFGENISPQNEGILSPAGDKVGEDHRGV